tara:strand:+ start:12335 stop:13210 length:876 start_codon:yes stop_codon:yes gene_type:complete
MAAKKTGKELANWQSAMAEAATKQAEMEQSTGGGSFFSFRAGQMKFGDVALPGDQIPCVIVHSIHENVYYEGKYDPDNKAPPACFAFWDGDEDTEMAPHPKVDEEDIFERQSEDCDSCPLNAWGSAETGKGKACKNQRRLAVIPAGMYKAKGGRNSGYDLEMFEDPKDFKKSDLAFMKLPVMSVKNFSAYVREVSEQLGKPTWAVFTNVYLEPDDKSQFRVCFDLIGEIPEELMETVYGRVLEAQGDNVTDFPYRAPSDDEEEAAAPVKNNAAKKLAGKAPAKGRQSRAKK